MALPAELEKEETQGKRGRPFGSTTKISKLSRISTRLEQMARTQAMTIIQKSLDNKPDVDKEQLSTAKWVVTTSKQFHQAILAEKESWKAKEEGKTPTIEIEEDEEDGNKIAKFSLVMTKEE